jgi:hypothetical protein
MPRPEDLHIDAALSGFALDYAMGLETIGQLVAPVLNSTKQSNRYWVADKKAMRLANIDRLPGDEYARIEWGYSHEPFHCKGYGLKAVVPKEDIANADPQVDPSADAIAAVTGTIMRQAEVRIAATAFDPGTFTQTSALQSPAPWDDTTPDPWGNRLTANAAVQPATGQKVNTLIISDTAWELLRAMTAIKVAIFGTQGPYAVPTPEQVAAVLGIKRIWIGTGSYWDDATQAFVPIWGNSALWAYYPESVDANAGHVIVPMRTFVWNVDGVARFQVSAPEWVQSRKSWVHYVDDYTDEKAVCAAAGYLFTAVYTP